MTKKRHLPLGWAKGEEFLKRNSSSKTKTRWLQVDGVRVGNVVLSTVYSLGLVFKTFI
jgi:hypothetical protein